MKVLFLDVDGVLNSADFFAAMGPTKHVTQVDPKAVQRVLRVVAATGAKIVLSSTWRLVPSLVESLKACGLPIHDVTPSLAHSAYRVRVDGGRGEEIVAWLRAHRDVRTFAIIDDDPDAGVGYAAGVWPFRAGDLSLRFVRTHWRHGMYGKHERRLIELLGRETV